jgi:hypothetical protein
VNANNDIRQAAKSSGVKLWRIAERLGWADNTFSRKLRRELSTDEKEKIITIIKFLSKEGD